jgi:phthalate 4,5-cis-dihydrodiol dehydrogenase
MTTRGRRTPPLRVGIGGLGVVTTTLLPELIDHPHYKITAAADPRQKALEAFAREFGAETYPSIEEMCKSPTVDLVYICTPTHLHAQHAIIAAELGKNIIADKPMGMDLQECDAVIQAVERSGVKLLVGHTQALDRPILKMAEIAQSGELGKTIMINTLAFIEWLYRPRAPEELDPTKGGGVVYRQGPTQIDIVRKIGGGRVRSVRAMTSAVDRARPVEGSYTAYLEFEDGTPASMVYNGYMHFDTSELTFGISLLGVPADPGAVLRNRQKVTGFARREEEWAAKEALRYGGGGTGAQTRSEMAHWVPVDMTHQRRHPFNGLTLVSCEKGDIRQSPKGLLIYGDSEIREVPVPAGEGYTRQNTTTELDEMYEACVHDRPVMLHDARWGKATVEVLVGILQSARDQREVFMHHQTPYQPPAFSW